jgi:hypothetical protein
MWLRLEVDYTTFLRGSEEQHHKYELGGRQWIVSRDKMHVIGEFQVV